MFGLAGNCVYVARVEVGLALCWWVGVHSFQDHLALSSSRNVALPYLVYCLRVTPSV